MNLNTQYSIIGGSGAAFMIVLVVLFLPQTGDESLPISSVGEQVISSQINDNDDRISENNDRAGNLEESPLRSEPEEIVMSGTEVAPSIEITPTTDLPSNNALAFRSGGGGGGGGSSSNEDDDDNVDFLVIPESPLGIVALVGSSLAALGAFMFLRRRSSNTGMTGLGI